MDYSTFAGNLKKTNASVAKLDLAYNHTDCRCWSAVVNQGAENIIVTHSVNRGEHGAQNFDVFTSTRIITDVEPDDIFDTIDMIVNRSSKTATPEIA